MQSTRDTPKTTLNGPAVGATNKGPRIDSSAKTELRSEPLRKKKKEKREKKKGGRGGKPPHQINARVTLTVNRIE